MSDPVVAIQDPVVTIQVGTAEAPMVQSFVISPANIAMILQKIITAEPKILNLMNELAPFAPMLPEPFNVLANPLVKEAVDALPTLLPLLQQLVDLLNQMSPPTPPVV